MKNNSNSNISNKILAFKTDKDKIKTIAEEKTTKIDEEIINKLDQKILKYEQLDINNIDFNKNIENKVKDILKEMEELIDYISSLYDEREMTKEINIKLTKISSKYRILCNYYTNQEFNLITEKNKELNNKLDLHQK